MRIGANELAVLNTSFPLFHSSALIRLPFPLRSLRSLPFRRIDSCGSCDSWAPFGSLRLCCSINSALIPWFFLATIFLSSFCLFLLRAVRVSAAELCAGIASTAENAQNAQTRISTTKTLRREDRTLKDTLFAPWRLCC